jgi:geranylgeranyl diphosphate synthase type II
MGSVQNSQAGAEPPAPGTSAAAPPTGIEVPADWHRWFDNQRARVDAEISNHLKALKRQIQPHSRLLESVEYSLVGGGKRLRPVLVLEACRVCGGTEEAAWPAALAVEYIHTFSLIHDDLPAMDDDDLRRGKPTSHKVFGEGLAILAGDWLVAHAFDLLVSESVDREIAPDLVRALANGTRDMISGQAADIAGEQQPTDAELVQFIHRHKTARLLEASCEMGALCGRASADELEGMAKYGRHLGLAFQITDDLLDRGGAAEDVGKRVGKNKDALKQTYPAAFGIAESRRQARGEAEAAAAALERFGARADHLRNLAWYVLARDR